MAAQTVCSKVATRFAAYLHETRATLEESVNITVEGHVTPASRLKFWDVPPEKSVKVDKRCYFGE